MMVCVGKYNKLWTCQKQKTTFNKFINTILDTVAKNIIGASKIRTKFWYTFKIV